MPQTSSTQAIVVALVCNIGLTGAKFAAALATGSSAMLSSAIHSGIDTSSQALLAYGQHRASRPGDARAPFGYAREVYFWSYVAAILLFSIGAGVTIFEGIDKCLTPSTVAHPQTAYAVLIVALMLQVISLRSALLACGELSGPMSMVATMRAAKDPALITLLVETVAALIGQTVALAGLVAADQFGAAWADGVASVLIGLVLATVAAVSAIMVKGVLIGDAADQQVMAARAGSADTTAPGATASSATIAPVAAVPQLSRKQAKRAKKQR